MYVGNEKLCDVQECAIEVFGRIVNKVWMILHGSDLNC